MRDKAGMFVRGHKFNVGRTWIVKDPSKMGGVRFFGEESPQWKGGKPICLDCKSPLSNYGIKRCKSCGQKHRWDIVGRVKRKRRGHNSRLYEEWRARVFNRDGLMCRMCNLLAIRPEAHHIKAWVHFPELRYDPDNGMTVCRDCHKKTDNYAGKAKRLKI